MALTQKDIAEMAPKVAPYLSDDQAEQVRSIFLTVKTPDEEDVSYRIGAGKGKFNLPDDFDDYNEEIYKDMERYALS